MQKNVKGYDLQKSRTSIQELISMTDASTSPIERNEVMFEKILSPSYIKAVAAPKKMIEAIIMHLESHGIKQLNGKPIKDCVLDIESVNSDTFIR